MSAENLHIPPLVQNSLPTVMINLLSDKGFHREWMNGIDTLEVLEQEIFKLIENYAQAKEERLRIFHLIQIWGGFSGRNIYLNSKDGFNWDEIDPQYEKLINVCRSIKDHSLDSRGKVLKAIKEFNKSVKGIGISFITKHTRFWLYNGTGDNMLPIFDSIMAIGYMKDNNISYKRLKLYWGRIIGEADEKKVSLAEYERMIFNQIAPKLREKRKREV